MTVEGMKNNIGKHNNSIGKVMFHLFMYVCFIVWKMYEK